MAGFFDSIFGLTKKENLSEIYQDPPELTLASGSVEGLTGGYQGLIDMFTRRSQGQDQFDFIKFLFEPQLNRLNEAFGISGGGKPLTEHQRRSGALGRTESALQSRGLLDSGVSGVLQAQLEGERSSKEAELFGQAKQMQRADIDNSYANLQQLYPMLFDAQNIPNQVQYANDMNRYNVATQRNAATAQQRASRASQKSNAIMGGIGLAISAATGLPPGLFGGSKGSQGASFLPGMGSLSGGYGPNRDVAPLSQVRQKSSAYDMKNLFGNY